jgi:hypothetical protein
VSDFKTKSAVRNFWSVSLNRLQILTRATARLFPFLMVFAPASQ